MVQCDQCDAVVEECDVTYFEQVGDCDASHISSEFDPNKWPAICRGCLRKALREIEEAGRERRKALRDITNDNAKAEYLDLVFS